MAQPSMRTRWLAVTVMAAGLAIPCVAAAPQAAAAPRAHRHHGHHHHGAKKKGAAVVREVRSTNFGDILETRSGQTVYVLVSKSGASLPCTGACASVWPPVVAHGRPRSAKGLHQKLLGTTKDGNERQVTYDHHPLYRFTGDTAKRDTNGEGVKSFGGEWFVIGPHGTPVKASVTSSKSGSGGSGSGSGGGGW